MKASCRVWLGKSTFETIVFSLWQQTSGKQLPNADRRKDWNITDQPLDSGLQDDGPGYGVLSIA